MLAYKTYMHKEFVLQAGWYLWLILVTLSPLSTKVAGTAWGMAGIWALWLAATQPRQEAQTAAAQALYRATTALLWCFGLAFVARTIGQFYWADGWEFRHFDARMLSIAVTLHIVVRRVTFSSLMCKQLIIALSLASLAALYTSYRYIHELSIPTNIIPWAYGMALFAAVLAAVRMIPKDTSDASFVATRWLAPAGALLLLVAILLVGVRGAYWAVVWVLCVILFTLRHALSRQQITKKHAWLVSAGVAMAIAILVLTVPSVYEVPKERIVKALTEVKSFNAHDGGSSVGFRLHVAQRAVDVIVQHPWMGIGAEGRTEQINAWSLELKHPKLVDMVHAHSEYLNAVLDYGSLGAVATLAYLLGLFIAALYLRTTNLPLSVCLAGLFFTTFTTFLTNANTLHNYSSVTLGLAMFFSVVLFSKV